MEGFAAFVLGLGLMAAAQDATYAPYRVGQPYYYYPGYYSASPATYADGGYRPAYVYAPAPLPAMGAMAGGLAGAGAAGAPGLLLGAAAGAVIGDALSMPPVVRVAPAYGATGHAPAASARQAEFTDHYIRRWQGFVEPAPQR